MAGISDTTSKRQYRRMVAGGRYGRLVAIEQVGYRGTRPRPLWRFRCDCGNEHITTSEPVLAGGSKSCGCFSRENSVALGRSNKTHGMHQTHAYRSWRSMNTRCRNQKSPDYGHYGARGIQVCVRWHTFANFIADMGTPPSARHSLDRYPDKTGNYEPGNVRWATMVEQHRNRTNNFIVSVDGRSMTLAEASILYSVKYQTAYARLKSGWTVDRALKAPAGSRHS